MIDAFRHSLLTLVVVGLLELIVIARILLRAHRDPASRIAWIVVVAALPLLGMLGYLLFGEVNIGRRRVARAQVVVEGMTSLPRQNAGEAGDQMASVPGRYRHLFDLGRSISGFGAVGGNTGHLLPDSNSTIDAMVADIDAAHAQWFVANIGRRCVKPACALRRACLLAIRCCVHYLAASICAIIARSSSSTIA
jgi:cardiolipin synthase